MLWSDESQLLTTNQICKALQVSNTTWGAWVKKYGIPRIKYGDHQQSRVRYRVADVNKILEQQVQTTVSDAELLEAAYR